LPIRANLLTAAGHLLAAVLFSPIVYAYLCSKKVGMIKQLKVDKLWGRENFTFEFHPDLNILTGSNGSGKTTLLKLLWYMVSGHARLALEEISFAKAYAQGQKSEPPEIHEITLTKTIAEVSLFGNDSLGITVPGDRLYSIKHNKKKTLSSTFDVLIVDRTDMSERELRQQVGEEIQSVPLETIFFPTFRRFEGGFSLGHGDDGQKVIDGLREFSKRMTHGIYNLNNQHRFVAYADDDDIRGLINEISSNIRVKLQPIEDEFMQFVKTAASNASTFAQQLKDNIAHKEQKEAQLKEPLTKLSHYIDTFFLEKSVEVSEELVLGNHSTRVKLSQLSAGEKNLLNFLVYAMGSPDVMFIDEPELNLHTDWQRLLLGVLREIAPRTQFFVATHASAIRAAYPEKQFFLYDQLFEA